TSLKLTITAILILFTTNAYAIDWKAFSAEWNVAPDPSATLLETIKKEAAASEVYQPKIAYYSTALDVSFTQYLSYYRLKCKIAQATESDIDECVQEFDNLNTKEQAYVLTALFIYERIHRRPLVSDEEWKLAQEIIIEGFEKKVDLNEDHPARRLLRTLTSSYNISRTYVWREIKEFDWFPYRPLTFSLVDGLNGTEGRPFVFKTNEQRMFLLPPSDFPPDNLNGTVSETVWEQRVNVIKKCTHSDEIAFPAFHPEEAYAAGFDFYGENGSKLRKKWLADIDICLQFIEDSEDLKISTQEFEKGREALKYLGQGTTVPYVIEEFFRRTDEKERTAAPNCDVAAAIREYYIVWNSTYCIFIARRISTAYGNSSSKPKTLGEIAQFLLEGRIQYDKPFFDEELLKRGVDGETGAK
ncbi:MAG: hypothetical protein II622_01885, partial [Thermoguttaceae bacterium]|nr:hypothetical protein [Thermoguttaceae bacterium]